jgi:hypothetical protein
VETKSKAEEIMKRKHENDSLYEKKWRDKEKIKQAEAEKRRKKRQEKEEREKAIEQRKFDVRLQRYISFYRCTFRKRKKQRI